MPRPKAWHSPPMNAGIGVSSIRRTVSASVRSSFPQATRWRAAASAALLREAPPPCARSSSAPRGSGRQLHAAPARFRQSPLGTSDAEPEPLQRRGAAGAQGIVTTPSPEMPLAGITVLELGQFIAGPFAAQLL